MIPVTGALIEAECVEQEENYVDCISKTQQHWQCETEEISWYCRDSREKRRPEPLPPMQPLQTVTPEYRVQQKPEE